jgi:type III restriction enzyme
MNLILRQINQRLSLRKPQQVALETLVRLVEKLPLKKEIDLMATLAAVQEISPLIADFEREFPNLCFALATGVGKTRLMGAMVAYLSLSKSIRNFFVLAPNNTIMEKLVREFSNPTDPKYVFQGIGEFANKAPRIITADNYDQGFGVRNSWTKQLDFFKGDEIHVNIFNIAMIHSRGDQLQRIRRPRETIQDCLSYFDYLAQLDDLVILMDEAHHYRASAASKAIHELKPVLGIELTATPHTENSGKTTLFQNVAYHYTLADALNDGLVKEPWVAGRENFDKSKYDEAALERLKIEDGIRIHESTKILLQNYGYEQGQQPIKPLTLIMTQSTAHANEIEKIIKSDDFFEGRYKNKIRVVHSGKKADEEERMIKDLLEVESFDNPSEIIIHVNKLTEGWDVKNLYTIIPLRAANSKKLIEQSLGRGLRLPFGKRTGVSDIDRLTIVSHDRFAEIVKEANNPNSIIKAGILIDRDIPLSGIQSFEVRPKVTEEIQKFGDLERSVAKNTLELIAANGSQSQDEITEKVIEAMRGEVEPQSVRTTVNKVFDLTKELSISIPRIRIEPEVVKPGRYHKFSLNLEPVLLQPIAHPLLLQNLHDGSREQIMVGHFFDLLESPQNYLANALFDFNTVAETDDNLELVLDLSEQTISHLKSYLKDDEELRNVLLNYREKLVTLIHNQMQLHYEQPQYRFANEVARDSISLKSAHYAIRVGQEPVHFDGHIDPTSSVYDLLFTGFKRSCYPVIKFDSHSERLFATILEHDQTVVKWVKPPKGSFQIFYHKDHAYEPDFVVETAERKLLCEIKRRCDLQNPEVIQKADAAANWCLLASNHIEPWNYLLIPHDAIDITASLDGLAARYEVKAASNNNL